MYSPNYKSLHVCVFEREEYVCFLRMRVCAYVRAHVCGRAYTYVFDTGKLWCWWRVVHTGVHFQPSWMF
jgi:hypothetical protein